MPFETLTMIESCSSLDAMLIRTPRATWDGVARRTREAPDNVASKSQVANTPSGIAVEVRYDGLNRCLLIEVATSSLRDQRRTSCPDLAAMTASAVPQLPAPIMAMRFMMMDFCSL